MTDLAELVVRIKADATQLQAEMTKTTSTVKQSASQMSDALESVKGTLETLGIAFGAAAIVEFGKSSLEAAFNIQNLSERIGYSASSLAALRPILASTGSSVEEFSHSVYMMNNFIDQAIDGNKKAITTLNDLGLSATALKNMKPEDAMNAMMDAIYRLGNITDQTAAGRAVFSRQWATLIPLMTESKGHLEDLIADMRQVSPTEAELKFSHDFWASMEDGAIRAQNAVIRLIYSMGQLTLMTIPGYGSQNPNVSTNRPQTVDQATHDPSAINAALKARGMSGLDMSGAGSNDDIAEQSKFQVNEVQTYIKNLQGEAIALNQSKLSLEMYNAEKQAASKAIEDYNNGLRASKDLTDQERGQIDEAVASLDAKKKAMEEVNKEQEKATHMQAQMQAEISSAMAQGILDYKKFGTTVHNVLSQIAKQILEMNVTSPISKFIGGSFSGVFSSLFGGSSGIPSTSGGAAAEADFTGIPAFASGGSPPVGTPSLVGENGPELFVPNQAGTIIPNGRAGAGGVTLHQTLYFSQGVQEAARAEIMNAIPSIVSASHDAVLAGFQKGGADSRIARLRA